MLKGKFKKGVYLTDDGELGNDVGIERDGDNLILKGNVVVETTSEVVLEAGQKIYFNGDGGDTYIVFNDAENRLEIWVNGALQIHFP